MARYLEIKDKCPAPELYWGSKPHSIVIETSQFESLAVDSSGPTSLLSLLKTQYPEGIAITERSRSIVAGRGKLTYKTKRYLEIAFDNEAVLKQALSRPFEIQDQAIKFSKTLNKANGEAYQLHISDIEQLGNPLKYQETLLQLLSKYGKVECLYLHYTKEANWFTGEGYAIWIGNFDEFVQEFAFEGKLKARFSYSKYQALETDETRVRSI